MTWKVLYGAWLATEIAILLLTRRVGREARDRGSLLLLWLVIVASIAAGTWFGETHQPSIFGGGAAVRLVATVLLAAGLLIRWSAILKLGKFFTANVAIQEQQKVETSGIFRFIRHPSYLGLLMNFAAIGLRTRTWLGFCIILLPTTAALLYRIHVEEVALKQAFGDDYLRYSRNTKRLIPGLF